MTEIIPLTEDQRLRFAARLHSTTKAENTRRSYHSDWLHFQRWAEAAGASAMPASEESLIAYLLYWGDPAQPRREGDEMLSASTLGRRVFGIREQHRLEGQPLPDSRDALISDVVKYLTIQQRSTNKRGRKKALMRSQLNRIVDSYGQDTPLDIRNRSILLLAFYSAMRRSSVTSLNVEDVEWSPDGDAVRLYVAYSKTDQRGEGRHIYISAQEDHCPIEALRRWLSVRGGDTGPLYLNLHHSPGADGGRLNDAIVNRLVKAGIQRIGLDPRPYGAHSLRSGFATQASQDGTDPRLIKEQTGHKSYEMLDRYIQDGTAWSHNATVRPASGGR